MARRPGPGGPERWTTLVVDAAPDFRLQTLAAGVKRLDALLLTHDHADQCHGIDDIRAFAIAQRRRIDCWMDATSLASLARRFGYIFEGEGIYPPIAQAHLVPPHGVAWNVDGPSGAIPVITFQQDHGTVKSLGYRFGPIAYSSDVINLDEAAFKALAGVEVWIVDALRYTPHPTHAHLERSLEWIARVRPRQAILTNMHIDLDYRELAGRLPEGVTPAVDGMRMMIELAEADA
jgi:phosphoribosyl 1,2-cyclic phosphate phosphodiesterase